MPVECRTIKHRQFRAMVGRRVRGRKHMQTKMPWRVWAFSLFLILVVLSALSFFLDVETIGATGRFVWNAVAAALLLGARGIDTILAYVLRRRLWRVASFFTAIGLGYSGNVILRQSQMERARGWHGRCRKRITRLRQRWSALGTVWKFLVVALLITAQIALLPVISQYVLLIPIGFLIPLVAGGTRRFYAWLANSLLAVTYRRYFGPVHRAAARKGRALAVVRGTRGALRLIRMRYLCAWRLWKYDRRYRDPTGELWVSLFEPIRLWQRGKLDHYIGHPLLACRRADGASKSTTQAPLSALVGTQVEPHADDLVPHSR